MIDPKDNPPAFPNQIPNDASMPYKEMMALIELCKEMTLLDAFAKEAMKIISMTVWNSGMFPQNHSTEIANHSYNLAEAILLERKKRMNKESK